MHYSSSTHTQPCMPIAQSEVAQLRQQIEAQLEAMQRGLYGLSSGRARHAFIAARMEHIGAYQDTLANYIGDGAATRLVCELYVDIMER